MSDTIKQFFFYIIIGASGVTIDFACFNLLIYCNVHYMLANCISVSSGIINNFFLNRKFTFKKNDKSVQRFISFFLVGSFGLLLSSLILFINQNYIHMNVVFAKIISIVLIALIQFTLNKFITFA